MAGAKIGAIIYENNVFPDAMMDALLGELRRAGLHLGGVHQHRRPSPVSNCDMDLEELNSGKRFHIHQDRGKQARGCMLDTSILADVAAEAARGLAGRPDLVLINKFGKEEAEGRGLRELIVQAVDENIPLLICVPARNRAAWDEFAGDFSDPLEPDLENILAWLDRLELNRTAVA